MKILITGSEGNVGSKLVPFLESKGHEVLCLDIVQKFRPNYILCDILNLTDAEKEIQDFKPTVVYHLAAMVSRITCEKSIAMAVNVNLTGTVNMVQLCKRIDAKLINFSTSEVYGNQDCLLEEDITPMPNNMYGMTKYMAEQLVEYESKSNGLRYINLRPFMMYSEDELMGENRSAMIRFAENITKGLPITVHLGAKRSWLHVSDAVVLLEKMLYVNENVTLNMGNAVFMDIEHMAKFMCEYAGKSLDLIQCQQLPDKMTLSKSASFKKQLDLLKYTPKMKQEDGIKLVMDTVKKRLTNEIFYCNTTF